MNAHDCFGKQHLFGKIGTACKPFCLSANIETKPTEWCAVPENIHIPSHRRDWNFLGGGCPVRSKNLKKCITEGWGGGSYKKSLPWERDGYFLELHILKGKFYSYRYST